MSSPIKATIVRFTDNGRILNKIDAHCHSAHQDPTGPMIEVDLDTLDVKHHLSVQIDLESLIEVLKENGLV